VKIFNPASEELIEEVDEDTPESVQEKHTMLKKGQVAWAAKPIAERIAIIEQFSDLLADNSTELARVESQEMGKPVSQAINEISGACKRIKYFTEECEDILKESEQRKIDGLSERLSFEPLGVIANISVWNYPFVVGASVFIPALIAGNAVMYKPSEYTTLTGLGIERLMLEAGVPDDVFVTVIGDGKVGSLLLDLPLNGYFFTGSFKTGQSIAKKLAGRMVKVDLELGGKDPLYVADDVDVKLAAAKAVDGVFYNNGQTCCAVERVYVHEKIYEPFIDCFMNGVGQLKMGDPLQATTTQGPLTRPQHATFLSEQIDDAVAKGARLLGGGKKVKGRGAFFEPTVLADVTHEMSLMTDETFGPVIGIQKVKDDDEALGLMQDTEYGLTAAVFSKNEKRARKILDQLNVGSAYWNCCDRVSPYLPWSGRGHSGFGATNSHLGILAFVKPKAYHLKSG